MYPKKLRRKFREIKSGRYKVDWRTKEQSGELLEPGVLPLAKAKENDIMRHTFISNLSRVEEIGEVCYQCATSMAMIRRHYKVLIADQKQVDEYFGILPQDFGL